MVSGESLRRVLKCLNYCASKILASDMEHGFRNVQYLTFILNEQEHNDVRWCLRRLN